MNQVDDAATVTVLAAGERRQFSLPWETTVGDLERLAVETFGLKAEPRLELWCADGTSMSTKMGRTLEELRERLICPQRAFELRVPKPRA